MLPAPVLHRPRLPMLLRATLFCRVNSLRASFSYNLYARAPVGCFSEIAVEFSGAAGEIPLPEPAALTISKDL